MQFIELPNSSQFTRRPPGLTQRYRCLDEHDPYTVQAFSLGMTPQFVTTPVGVLYRQNVQVDEEAHKNFLVTATYVAGQRDVGQMTFSFDAMGATVHITQAREHIASYPAADLPSDPHKGAINVDQDGRPQGCDIVVPALRMTYTFRHPQGVVTEALAAVLANAAGHTNSAPWRGFAAGTLLFLGATGSDGSENEAEVAYHVAAERSETITMGAIMGIVKAGWHYVWAEFEADTDDGHPVTKAKRVHVERTYDPINFATHLGFS